MNSLSSSNFISLLITHVNAPISLQLNRSKSPHVDDHNDVQILVIHCQISSNLYFYTTLLSELSSSTYFANLFSQFLIRLNTNSRSKIIRTRLKYLFSSIVHRSNQIYLQVHDQIYRFDEWINRRW